MNGRATVTSYVSFPLSHLARWRVWSACFWSQSGDASYSFFKVLPCIFLPTFLKLNGYFHYLGRIQIKGTQRCLLRSLPVSIKHLFAAKANFGKVMASCKSESERAVRHMPKKEFQKVSAAPHVVLHENSEGGDEECLMSAIERGDDISRMTC